uniref:ATP synthase subunit b, chloroplastic n=1 Tax=Ochrosphaera neapolitana TaxID=35137 RepID=ATPF_OCHNE|nr:ATP synthase CF0 B subunit [Ochrosphaera neapolitana]Q40609.1 RecName: Full=ATP synthase subunit b, chloroplastic; AltName: Full=ATP synthase F(0) sector subunit b; AltName: Full=ATPase subunit I [Ochrosphaera neapolitana]WKK50091.1 ATP synthase CF0 B subunit [Ochrosphaera neapolitana]CAA67538.1 subunit I of ATPase [Ochrosphaera neapolitana]
MHLFTQTLVRFSSLIADGGVSFNPDIFETNVVNLAILTGGIFYLGSNALSESLVERQQKILGAIQEAEERLEQATERLKESKTQLEQAQLVIASIKEDAETTAKQVKSAILTEGKNEIERLTSAAKSQIVTIEAQVRKQISDYVVSLALQRVTLQLEGKLSDAAQQQILDRNISKLKD